MTQGQVAVVGTGTIGGAWAALFLAAGRVVHAHDPADGAHEQLRDAVETAWPALVALGARTEPPWKLLTWHDSVRSAVSNAGFVQESGPERLDVKQALIAEIDAHAPPATVVASSSSGLRPSTVAAACTRNPERILIGHPFHPAYLIPLVEVVGGEQTAQQAVEDALAFYVGVGKRPVLVRMELDGHLVNRLQAALWREAYDLVARGAVTVADVDAAITNGPGLRWAAVGPFAGQHLSGGAGGIAHNLEHLGEAMVAWWHDMRTPEWTPELVARVTEQVHDEMGDTTVAQLTQARDTIVLGLLAAKSAEPRLTS